MSALNPPNKISKRQELRQDTVVTFYARAWDYFDKHRSVVYGAIAGLVALVLLVVGYLVYQSNQEQEARQLLGNVVGLYESGDFQTALDGREGTVGLLEIAEEYGGTDSGNLARFYTANALYQLGEYDRALTFFQDFDKARNFIGASAIAGEAAVYENKGEYARAGELYRRAATFFVNELTTPQYLFSAGRAFEEAGQLAQAQQAYEQVREDYPESTLAANIDFYIARVEAKQQVGS